MDSNKIKLLIYTLKYLKFKQIYYRLFYFIKSKFFNKKYEKTLKNAFFKVVWNDSFLYKNSFLNDNIFTFLNIKHVFEEDIDWNLSTYGKLWTFNLNYFDFLNQENIAVQKGVKLIEDFIANKNLLIEGKESYTISLRGINWVKFLSKNSIQKAKINQVLYNDYYRLYDNLELHFLGNHFLENGFSLLFGAYYFQDEKLYKKAKHILKQELNEQVLKDGAHFELSPMYHQTMLHRVLDCINLVKNNDWKQLDLLSFLNDKAIVMLGWLQTTTFKNGNIPMVNDSAYNISPNSESLFKYAKYLELSWIESKLSDSGYRKIMNINYELFLDIGNVGASYQPAHVHSDTFNFELYVNKKPVIVDTGTSTYEKNEKRQLERSTESHNTVKIGNNEQSEIWSGFRVAERAKIIFVKETENRIEATHNGYKKIGISHTRIFSTQNKSVIIQDSLSKSFNGDTKAYLHFHPDIETICCKENTIELVNNNIQINFSSDAYKINIIDYNFAAGFNKTVKAKKAEIYFKTNLKTQINLLV